MGYIGKYHDVIVNVPFLNGEQYAIVQLKDAEVRMMVVCDCGWWRRKCRPNHKQRTLVFIQTDYQ